MRVAGMQASGKSQVPTGVVAFVVAVTSGMLCLALVVYFNIYAITHQAKEPPDLQQALGGWGLLAAFVGMAFSTVVAIIDLRKQESQKGLAIAALAFNLLVILLLVGRILYGTIWLRGGTGGRAAVDRLAAQALGSG